MIPKNEKRVEKLELLREKMLQAASKHGLTHPLVLTYSKEIDLLHNDLMRLEKRCHTT